MRRDNDPTHLPQPLRQRRERDEDEAYDLHRQRKLDEAESRLCRDCRYATHRYSDIRFCNRTENIRRSQMDGELEYVRSCRSLRENDKTCGPEARWFAPKEGA